MNALTVIPHPSVPAMTISDVARVAEAIAQGGLFGTRDLNAVLTLCLLAQAEGQHPAVVFRDYHIIQGKPAKKADAMLRDFINSGGKVEWHTLDDGKADATFTHPSGSARIDWTLERARTAGIANPMWKKYPRQMLRSRVISEGVRTVYPGATSGLYEENEVRDIVADTPTIDGGDITGHSQHGELSPDAPAEYGVEAPETPPKRENWGGRYPTKTALKKAMHTHHAELERLGIEGAMDDLEDYLQSPEYQDFIAQASEHAPYYLEGDLPDSAPPEFLQTFKLEAKARDMIVLRGNMAGEMAQ